LKFLNAPFAVCVPFRTRCVLVHMLVNCYYSYIININIITTTTTKTSLIQSSISILLQVVLSSNPNTKYLFLLLVLGTRKSLEQKSSFVAKCLDIFSFLFEDDDDDGSSFFAVNVDRWFVS
jgi:hypothetical protein